MFIFLIALFLRTEENYILKNGIPLSLKLQKIAINLGIKNPENIRILEKGKIFGDKNIAGMTLNRGILIIKKCENKEDVLIHELIHVKQYQDLGGMNNFLNRYVKEILKYGYYDSPLEIEARIKKDIIVEELNDTSL